MNGCKTQKGHRLALLVSVVTVLLLSAYTKPTKFYLYFFFSAALFIVLQKIGSIVEHNKIGQRVSNFVGGISYEIFLIQHIVILQFLYRNDPVDKEKVFLNIVAIIIVCIVVAKILKLVSGKVVSAFFSAVHVVLRKKCVRN